jgi:hypothetical protein
MAIGDSKLLLEKIATEYSRSSDLIIRNLRGSVDVVKMTYGVAPHRQFVLEYLQNAIDAGAKRCAFKIYEDHISFTNDGQEFNTDNVESICSIAQSSKQPAAGFVGFIGVGAKSAFLLGERLEVHSGYFHFAFDKSIGEDKPWEILPQPIERCLENPCYINQDNYNTTFVLSKLNSDVPASLNRIFFEHRDDYYIDARTLLFLPADQLTLEVVNAVKKTRRTISRRTLNKESVPIKNTALTVEKIILEEVGEEQISERWLVLTKNVTIDPDVRKDALTKLYRRETVTERQISVAFLLDDNDDLTGCHGVVKFGVFSYMPLKEIESGLNFLIHCDFITEPGRATIASEARWNLYLRSKIEEFILNTICDYIKTHDRYRSQTLILTPSKTVGGFFGELTTRIRDKLRGSDVVLTYHGYRKPSESLVMPTYVFNLLSREKEQGNKSLLSLIISPYPTKFEIAGERYLAHEEVVKNIERLKISRETLRGIGIYVLPFTHIVANVPNRRKIDDVYHKVVETLDVTDYAEMFDYLLKRELEDVRQYTKPFFTNLVIITESGHKSPLRDIFALPYDKALQSISNKLLSNLVDKFWKHKLINQKNLHELKFFVKQVGNAYVERTHGNFNLEKEMDGDEYSIKTFLASLEDYARQEIKKLVDRLASDVETGETTDVKDVTNSLLEYFEIYNRPFNYDEIKSKVLFRVKDRNDFKKASELLLPYSDSHKLKPILDLIDGYTRKGCPVVHKYSNITKLLNFPDLEFYDNVEKEKLLNFIKSLGGDSILPDLKSKIVEAIGVQLVAIKEWIRDEGEVREVDGRTHDLEVMGNEVCYIEVKSTHSTVDDFEVELRGGQLDALSSETNTRLYIITEALTNPTLIIPRNEQIINSLKSASAKIKVKELIDSSTVQENIFSWTLRES